MGMIPAEAVEAAAKMACAEIVWDGPYKMTCSYLIVRGKCVRHGKNAATATIEETAQ